MNSEHKNFLLCMLCAACICGFGLSAAGQSNLLVNGNFSLGNTGFTSQYTYSHGNLVILG